MAIRTISIRRDNSPNNVNPKFHKPDGTVIPHWDSAVCNTPRSEYYLTPEVNEWSLISIARAGKPLPAGYILEKDETTHEGRVMAVTSADERIMSDVWEIVTRAMVFSPETVGQKTYEYGPVQESPYISVHVHTTGNYLSWGEAVVDCDPEIIAQWTRECEEKRQREEKARYEREAQVRRSEVVVGKIVRVNRGRKVAKGTTGKVFWIGNNGYGQSVGIALTPRKGMKSGRNGRSYESFLDVVFVSLTNVDVVGAESDDTLTAALAAWEGKA